jgi:uncharacterized protein (TIGR02118 family)
VFTLIVRITKPRDLAVFEEHFRTVHLALVRAIPGIKSIAVHKIVEARGSDRELWGLVELYCDDRATFQRAMSTPEAKEALQDGSRLEAEAGTTMNFDYYCETTEA